MNQTKNILWGIVLIIIGLIWGLNALDITNINVFFDGWWTLFIIIPCFIGLFNQKESKTGNIIGLIIGIVLLLCCMNVLDFDIVWKLTIPVILVVLGLSFILKDNLNNKINKEIKKINQEGNKENEYCATFSSQNIDFDKEEFNGANLTAVFGGVKCDLRKSIIKENQVINCSAIFGGISIYLPENVKVKIKSNSIFGGVSNNKKNIDTDKKEKIIYINAMCMFGGIDIK